MSMLSSSEETCSMGIDPYVLELLDASIADPVDRLEVAYAKAHGWDLDVRTGKMSADCNVCGTYAVLNDSCICPSCVKEYEL